MEEEVAIGLKLIYNVMRCCSIEIQAFVHTMAKRNIHLPLD